MATLPPTSKPYQDPRKDWRVAALQGPDSAEAERAFASVYEEEQDRIYGLLVRLTHNRSTAADLFQNVWLKLAKYAPRLRADTCLRAWLCTVARNEARSQRRAEAMDLSRLLCLGGDKECLPEEGIAADLSLALAQLPDSDRELLLLIGIDGLSYQQAGECLALPPSTLRKRVSRARARLRALLDRSPQPHAAETR